MNKLLSRRCSNTPPPLPRTAAVPADARLQAFLRNRAALASLVILGIIIIACFVGPLLLSKSRRQRLERDQHARPRSLGQLVRHR